MSPRAYSPGIAAAFLLAAGGCSQAPERAAFLTLMGNDTLAAEWMEFGDGFVEAQALVRGSQTTWHEYRLEMAPDGDVTGYSGQVWAAGARDGAPVSTETLVEEAGAKVLVTERGERSGRREFTGGAGSVPFVDMLHWPFEAAMRWQAEHGGLQEAVPTFTGRGASFALRELEDGRWHLVHPSRGPSTMRIDEHGRIQELDGTGSTRAYDLRRLAWNVLDPEAFVAMFADRPLGALSGRGHVDDVVAGVHFTGDYGAPRKRGRHIFGGLLAYGVWWRTGANAATQLSFDRDVVIDGVTVPAGDYSLSSIPEEDGGTLIINRRTGQGGQSYDEAEDQARVRMRRSALDETVEVFEIRVVPDGAGGRLELRWDDVVYWVPFTVG